MPILVSSLTLILKIQNRTMRIKKQLNLFNNFNKEIKVKIINRFLAKITPFLLHSNNSTMSEAVQSPLIDDEYLSDIIEEIQIDSLLFSIKILISKENNKTEYKEIIRYKYNINKGVLKGTHYDLLKYSDRFFINEHPILKDDELEREFYDKLNSKNILIENIRGIFVRLTYISSASST
jgi:hypothetical protein